MLATETSSILQQVWWLYRIAPLASPSAGYRIKVTVLNPPACWKAGIWALFAQILGE
jgi:hypothetical protein